MKVPAPCPHTLTLTTTPTYTHHIHTHTHTHTQLHTYTLTLSHTHTSPYHTYSHYQTITHTHTLSHTLSHNHTHTHTTPSHPILQTHRLKHRVGVRQLGVLDLSHQRRQRGGARRALRRPRSVQHSSIVGLAQPGALLDLRQHSAHTVAGGRRGRGRRDIHGALPQFGGLQGFEQVIATPARRNGRRRRRRGRGWSGCLRHRGWWWRWNCRDWHCLALPRILAGCPRRLDGHG